MRKLVATLVNKQELISKVYILTYTIDQPSTFNPGQFFSFQIKAGVNRPYSICYFDTIAPTFGSQQPAKDLPQGQYISFMISTKPGGEASTYFEETVEGDYIVLVGPSGRFAMVENDKPKVFVATGTGLAPFIPMIEKTLNQNPLAKVDLFFGAWKHQDVFVKRFFEKFSDASNYPNFKIYSVVEDLQDQTATNELRLGKVTTVIPEIITDYKNTDFYLCGHPNMVADMGTVLTDLGAEVGVNLFSEGFGVKK